MMKSIADYKEAIDTDLEQFSVNWRKEYAAAYTSSSLTILDALLGFLGRGGKRIRGTLAMKSYYLHGGHDQAVALGAARVMELVQASLLVMDDIQDQSQTRRGGPALHTQLAGNNGADYGVAQALNAEMLAMHRATTELMRLSVSDKNKVHAAAMLAQNNSVTVVGQINDISNQLSPAITERAIIDTLQWKTAYYTFISPLELGACLAGTSGLSERLRDYALHAGVAFQIHDDVLGVFGDQFEVGKSADDDIREGKATLLVAYARARATTSQRAQLDHILGRHTASAEECALVRSIFEATGARGYAYQVAQQYARMAETALGDQPEQWLVELARFAVERSS